MLPQQQQQLDQFLVQILKNGWDCAQKQKGVFGYYLACLHVFTSAALIPQLSEFVFYSQISQLCLPGNPAAPADVIGLAGVVRQIVFFSFRNREHSIQSRFLSSGAPSITAAAIQYLSVLYVTHNVQIDYFTALTFCSR